MFDVQIIVAMDANNGIGRQGGLPWRLPADLKRFRQVTSHTDRPDHPNVVVMGRKTWLSVPQEFRPLSNRINLICSRDPVFLAPEGVLTARKFIEAPSVLANEKKTYNEVFVIGGAQIYQEALIRARCRRIYVTRIHAEFACDTYFPPVLNQYDQVSTSPVQSQNNIPFSFQVYELRS